MARDKLNSGATDVTVGGTSILLSLVKGENLELPVVLDIFPIAVMSGYVYECLVVEAVNQSGDIPTDYKVGGLQHNVSIRIPTNRGAWNAGSSYSAEDMVSYGGLYYKRFFGNAIISPNTPNLDIAGWTLHDPRTIYLQFTTAGWGNWNPVPTVESPVYGFVELRVTETANAIYARTWKPLRGLLQLQFSPTELN